MKKTEKGFTIIEVALVLAIGALIFLVVFLAVPALQRNQRNDARKRDISNIVEAIHDYNANHPTSPFDKGEVTDTATLPDTTGTSVNTSEIKVYIGHKCKGLDNIEKGSGRQAAVMGTMERSGGYTLYCQDAS